MKKTFKVRFFDLFEAESEEQCYERLLEYLGEVVNNGDVCGFDFEEHNPSEESEQVAMNAKIQSESPYNDGWTKNYYKNLAEEMFNSKKTK